MPKLIDIFGTSYFHAGYSPKVDDYINKHPGETIDLAGAKLAADCARVVNLAINQCKCKFVDTQDKERQALLTHDEEMAANRKRTEGIMQPLPFPRSIDHMKRLLRENYSTPMYPKISSDQPLEWIILFMAKRHDVEFVLDGYVSKQLFITINKYYDRRSYAGRPVYYIRGNGDEGVGIEENPSLNFCNSHICCPIEFGAEDLYRNPNWERPLQDMVKVVVDRLHRTGRKIKDVLGGNQKCKSGNA